MKKPKPLSRKILNNIRKVYNQATADEREQGLYWYQTAHNDAQVIADRHGVTVSQAAGVIAAISPGLEWGLNLIQADEFIKAYKAGSKLPMIGVYGRKNMTKAKQILYGKEVYDALPTTGPKTYAFFRCIEGSQGTSLVVIDRHAKCLAYYQLTDRDKFSAVRLGEYDYLVRHYRHVAEQLDLIPHQLQAITWVTWKRIVTETVPF